MVTTHTQDAALDAIHRDGYRYLLMVDPLNDDLGFMTRWRWVGALAPHLYGLADSASRLPPAGVVATDPGPRAGHEAPPGTLGSGAPGTVTCGLGTRVRAGGSGTWLLFADPASNARVSVGGLAPVPARRAVFVAPALDENGTLVLTCSGAASLPVARVVDAPAPR